MTRLAKVTRHSGKVSSFDSLHCRDQAGLKPDGCFPRCPDIHPGKRKFSRMVYCLWNNSVILRCDFLPP